MKKLNLKKWVYNIVEKSTVMMNFYLHIFNKYSLDKNEVIWKGVRIKNNKLFLEGKDNKLICGRDNSIRNNVIRVCGVGNHVIIGDAVQMTGKGTQSIYIKGNNNQIIIENNAVMRNITFFICGDNNRIHISEKYSGIDVEFHVEESNGNITIGKNTSMHGRGYRNISFVLEEGTNIHVGEDCMIANNVQLRSSDSHSIIDMEGKRLNHAKDISIGNHCWIGMGSLLLKGTKIPNNIVVAAEAICNKEYEESNSILAGNPAKVVKRNVNWSRQYVE